MPTKPDNASGIFSGGPINDFREGWALIPFAKTPHYFRDISEEFFVLVKGSRDRYSAVFRSLCGEIQVTTPKVPALHVGAKQLCKRCQKTAPRWTRKEERETIWVDPKVRELFGR